MYKRGGVWWTSINYQGKRVRKSLDTPDKKLAQMIEAKIRTEIVEGKYFGMSIGESKDIKDMMDKFMREHAPKLEHKTQKSYTSYLKHLLSHFGNSKSTTVTPKMIAEYKVLRKGEGAKPATINRELAMFSKAFNLAIKEWEWVKENPVSKVPKEKENNKKDRWLTMDEEKRLLEASPQWLEELILFDLHTGLRLDELLSLEWNRIDIFRKIIVIQKPKNKEPRTIPLNQIALNLLMQKQKVRSIKNDLVFPSSAGTKIDDRNLERSLEGILKKTGIEGVTPHTLRHTFATRMAQKGIDIYKIAKLLGHKDIRMTQRYAHHCPDSLRDGVQILETGHNLVTIEEKREVVNV